MELQVLKLINTFGFFVALGPGAGAEQQVHELAGGVSVTCRPSTATYSVGLFSRGDLTPWLAK